MKRLLHIPTARYWLCVCNNDDTAEDIINHIKGMGLTGIRDWRAGFIFSGLTTPVSITPMSLR